MIGWEIILGGFVSGVIGGAGAVEFRYRRDKQRELQTWYNRTERLAQRVIRANYDNWTGSKPFFARATCAGVHSELASHVADAPPEVNERPLRLAEQLVSECQLVKMMDRRELKLDGGEYPEIRARVEEAADIAELVEDAARSEREAIRFLTRG